MHGLAWLKRFVRDERGAVAFIMAAFGMGLVATLAITIDVSNVYLARRQQQSSLDLAALAAARNLGTAETIARATLTANGISDAGALTVTLGNYNADAGKAASGRFVANGLPVNAVRLAMTKTVPLYFGRGLLGGAAPSLKTNSVAVNTRVASFTIGSRLASLNGGIANAMLSALLGTQISLNVMDYDALASATVDIPNLLSALPPRVGVTAATYNDVLTLNPTVSQFANALNDSSTSTSTSRLALTQIAGANVTKRIDLRQLIAMGPFGKLPVGNPTGLTAQVSALDVLFTAIGVANGNNQVDVDLGVQVPGLLGLTASVKIGERPQSSPWLAMGPELVSVRTVQTRVRLVASVGGPLGLPALKLPIAMDVAAGEATLKLAQCGANPRTDAQATLEITPTLAELWVGEPKVLADWNTLAKPTDVGPATVLDTLLLSATASAHVVTTNLRPRVVQFSATDIAQRTVKLVETSDIAQTTLTSLVGNLSVGVSLKLLGIGLGTPQSVSAALAGVLRPLGAVLDPPLNDTLKLLGVGLGEAEVAVRGLRCDGSALVM